MKTPPGPGPLAALQFFGGGTVAGTLRFLSRIARQYGPISSFRLFHQRFYLVDDAELVKAVLVTKQHDFKRDSGATLLRELVGDGLLTRDEPLHRERRRMIQPAFHKEQIDSYAEIMYRACESAVNTWARMGPFGLTSEMRRLTLSIVGSALFGAELRDEANGIAEALRSVMRKSGRIGPFIGLLEPFARAYRKRAPYGPSLFFSRERRELERILNPLLEKRKRMHSKDVISLLLEGGELGDEDIRNEVVTFVLAGHETTAAALTWACYLIAKHPRVRDRLEAEVDAVCASGPIGLETLAQLRYTGMTFQEAMRLFPPAPATARKTIRRVELAGYEIPKGSSVFVSAFVTHQNPRYFENPQEFRPERWEQQQVPKFAYFPFGGGAKMCIGEPFAKMEGVMALAAISRRMRLELHGESINRKHDIGSGITLQPDREIEMKATERPIRAFATSRPNAG